MKTKLKVNGFSGLPTLNDLKELMSFGELVKELYPDQTFDYARPLEFDKVCRENGLDPRGQCVWIYLNGMIGGEPAAVTHEFYHAYHYAFDIYPVCPVALRTLNKES